MTIHLPPHALREGWADLIPDTIAGAAQIEILRGTGADRRFYIVTLEYDQDEELKEKRIEVEETFLDALESAVRTAKQFASVASYSFVSYC